MKLLSRTEEMILLAVHSLNDKAYGISIRSYLRNLTGKQFSIGAIYVPLERLEEKGLLTSIEGQPTAERGGRSKRFFRLSTKGLEALENVRELNEALWKGFSDSQPSSFANITVAN
jgi:DNA-binding PadR family transcriptional regulator